MRKQAKKLSRTTEAGRWASLAAALWLVVPAMGAPGKQLKEARSLYKAAQVAETRDDFLAAYEDYYAAFEKDPADLRYKAAYLRLTVRAASAHVTQSEALQAYIDVGVEVEMTPMIHYDHDSTLKIKIVSSEESGTTTISGITEPIISQRTTEQIVRLRDGEVNILGGFMQKSNRLTVSGWPGLGEVPLLKYLFSSQDHEVQDDELVFMITPHIVRAAEITPENLAQVDSGTGANIELRRVPASDRDMKK